MLRATFVRTEGEPDRVYVRRGDGGQVGWTFPTYGAGLPHDLIHLVVESAFGIGDGFWGRVDRGVDPARVNALANRAGGPIGGRDREGPGGPRGTGKAGKYEAFGDDLRGLFLAEALAGAPWQRPDADDAEREAAVRSACAGFGIDVPRIVGPERIHAAKAVIDVLGERWRGLVPKGALTLAFHPEAPERSFPALADPPA